MLKQGFVFYKEILIYLKLLCFFVYCQDNDCWISFGAKEHFDIMDKIDDRYAEVRENFQKAVGGDKFDQDMLLVMLENRGIAERAIHKAGGDRSVIPAGINLGGHCMMRVPKSLLFFHRMKLRNNTSFRIVDLESNLTTLELKANLHLNDLHLFGSYDISHTLDDTSLLLYYPSFGEVQFLLKNVSYKLQGHYRLLHNRLNLELVTSEILMEDVLMMDQNQSSISTVSLKPKNIESFTDRLKVDLDKWIKDYFNDYLMYFVVIEDAEFEKYNQEKTKALNNYADKVIDIIKKRINDIQAHAVQLPNFTIKTGNGAEIQLRDGVLRGLDSIYRRSITSGSKENNIRKVNTVVGFSNLKLLYRYDTMPQSGLPPVTGGLTLIADDLTAHLGLALIKDPETADLSFKFLEQTKPESLTVEGSANRMISNFKYILERHVIGIMMNSLTHNINMLGTLDRCVPLFASFKDPTEKGTNTDYSLEVKNKIISNETSDNPEDILNENDHTHKYVEPEGSQQENQQESQEGGNVASSVKEIQPLSQEGPMENIKPPEVVETEVNHTQESQQKSQETDIGKETADNTLNSGDRDNTLHVSTNKYLIGNGNENNIEKRKKFKYLRRNPKPRIQKKRKKPVKY